MFASAASGCTGSARTDFGRAQGRLDAAASYALSQPIPGSEKAATVDLPERFRDLAVDGQVLHLSKNGREFVFFPQSVDGSTIYEGFLFSVDGDLPGDVLTGEIINLGDHWWQGELSGEFLA